jgi:hypothetical protein
MANGKLEMVNGKCSCCEHAAIFKTLRIDCGIGNLRGRLRSSLTHRILAHSHEWKSEGSKPVENVNRALERAARVATQPFGLIDMVCIADIATWNTMDIAKYDASWIPSEESNLRALFGGPWGVTTSVVCAAIKGDRQSEEFKPIGALISMLTQRLAWDDPSARDLTDYYRLADLWGTGSGPQRFWPASVYSERVRKEIGAGHLKNGELRDDWNTVIV